MDGVLAIGGCDKNMPDAMTAFARLNIPFIFVYGGTIKPGHYNGRDLSIVSSFEAVGEFIAHRIDADEWLAGNVMGERRVTDNESVILHALLALGAGAVYNQNRIV